MLIRPPGTTVPDGLMFFRRCIFFFLPLVLRGRGPSADRPETLPHGRNLAEFYNPTPKIRGASPKHWGPKTCKISVILDHFKLNPDPPRRHSSASRLPSLAWDLCSPMIPSAYFGNKADLWMHCLILWSGAAIDVALYRVSKNLCKIIFVKTLSWLWIFWHICGSGVVRWQIRWGGKWVHHCSLSSFQFFVSKIFTVGGNLTKFWQKEFCTVFFRHDIHVYYVF